MTDKTKKTKKRKPTVGSDPTKGSRTRYWQIGMYAFAIGASTFLIGLSLLRALQGRFTAASAVAALMVTGLSWTLLTSSEKANVDPGGLNLASSEPALTAFIESVANDIGAPIPDQIYLVLEPRLTVVEEMRYFGLQHGQIVVIVGLPFLHSLTKAELAALTAHHLGHFTNGDVDEGVRSMRALRAGADMIGIERDGIINGVFGSYSRKMLRSVGGVGVAQEHQAEQVAVETYGTEVVLSGLAKLDEVESAWDQMLRHYVVPPLQHGAHPAHLFAGFEELLASPQRAQARADDVERRRSAGNEFDPHNSPGERHADVSQWSIVEGRVAIEGGDELAHTLLDSDAKSTEIVVGTWANGLIDRQTVGQTWEQLADEVFSAESLGLASHGFEPDDERTATEQLDAVLDWSDDQWQSLDDRLKRVKSLKRLDAEDRRTQWLETVVTGAAAESGSHRWVHSWDGPPQLVGQNGVEFDAAPVAQLLATGDSADAREAFDQQAGAETTRG